MRGVTPPAIASAAAVGAGVGREGVGEEDDGQKASLLMMGFPSRIPHSSSSSSSTTTTTTNNNPWTTVSNNLPPSLCACHALPTPTGYLCSRCSSKICSLPCKCPVCGLTLILSTHLARSYHHLFPLRNWTEVSWEEARRSTQNECTGCLTLFPKPPRSLLKKNKSESERLQDAGNKAKGKGKEKSDEDGIRNVHGNANSDRKARLGPSNSIHKALPPPQHRPLGISNGNGVSESGRYACEACTSHFCIDCDVFAHEVVHNCPGCMSLPAAPTLT